MLSYALSHSLLFLAVEALICTAFCLYAHRLFRRDVRKIRSSLSTASLADLRRQFLLVAAGRHEG